MDKKKVILFPILASLMMTSFPVYLYADEVTVSQSESSVVELKPLYDIASDEAGLLENTDENIDLTSGSEEESEQVFPIESSDGNLLETESETTLNLDETMNESEESTEVIATDNSDQASIESEENQETTATENPVETTDGMDIDAEVQDGWIELDDEWYYFENGVKLQFEWLEYNDHLYYFGYDGQMASNGTYSIDEKPYFFNPNGTLTTNIGWYLKDVEDSSWVYILSDGSLQTGWLELDNYWYYFDHYGRILQNRTEMIDGITYFFKSDGSLEETITGWYGVSYESSGGPTFWWYILPGGIAHTGWLGDQNNWYYFNDRGGMIFSRVEKIDNKNYAFDQSGKMIDTEGWHEITSIYHGSQWVFLSSDTELHIGWLYQNNHWYYFDEYGYMMQSRSEEIDGNVYVFDANGAMVTQTGWITLNYNSSMINHRPSWHYVLPNGLAKTGWFLEKGHWYYFDEAGYMSYGGTYNIDEQFYLFNSDGTMNENPGWHQTMYDEWYYLTPQGKVQIGWLLDKGDWYYFVGGEYSYMITNEKQSIDGVEYYFDNSGKMLNNGWNYLQPRYEHWIYAKPNGILQTGWLLEGENWYYFAEWGEMISDRTLTIDGVRYSFDSNGVLQ